MNNKKDNSKEKRNKNKCVRSEIFVLSGSIDVQKLKLHCALYIRSNKGSIMELVHG